MDNLYVFGVTPFAEMLRYYIEEAGNDYFCGYVVDEEYMPENHRLGGGESDFMERFYFKRPCQIV